MAVRIRLTRVGATKRPAYRVIAIDKRRSRDGRALEILGFYDPLTEPATVKLDAERIKAWIGQGAQPSDTVVRLMRQADRPAAPAATEKPKRSPRPKATKAAAVDESAAAAESAPAEEVAPAEESAPADEAQSAADDVSSDDPAPTDEQAKA